MVPKLATFLKMCSDEFAVKFMYHAHLNTLEDFASSKNLTMYDDVYDILR